MLSLREIDSNDFMSQANKISLDCNMIICLVAVLGLFLYVNNKYHSYRSSLFYKYINIMIQQFCTLNLSNPFEEFLIVAFENEFPRKSFVAT